MPAPTPMAQHLLAFFLIGLSPWMLVNSIFAEMSLFINTQPEGNSIATVCAVAVSLANLCVLVAVPLATHCRQPPQHRHRITATTHTHHTPDDIRNMRLPQPIDDDDQALLDPSLKALLPPYRVPVLASLALAALCALLLTFGAKSTMALGGRDVSALLILVSFVGGGIGALSGILYWPFSSAFEPRMLTIMGTGMGLSSLVPALVALSQDAGKHPRYSVAVYFIIFVVLLVVGFAAAAFAGYTIPTVRHHATNAGDVSHPSSPDSPLLVEVQDYTPHDDDVTLFTLFGWSISVRLVVQLATSATFMMVPAIGPFLVDDFTSSDSVLLWSNVAYALGTTAGRLVCTWLQVSLFSTASSVWLGVGQTLSFALFFVFGYPASVSVALYVINSGAFAFLFGLNNTMLYKCAAVGHDDAAVQRTRTLGFAEQIGSAVGTSIALFLAIFAL